MINETETAATARDQMLDGSSLTEQETTLLNVVEIHSGRGLQHCVMFTDARTREIARNLLLHLWSYVGTDLHDAWVTEMYTYLLNCLEMDHLGTIALRCVFSSLPQTISLDEEPWSAENDFRVETKSLGRSAPAYAENEDPVYQCGICGAPGVNRRTCPGPGHYHHNSGEVSE